MLSGICKYGWFSHSEFVNISKNENNENYLNANEAFMEKIFQIMEKFTPQIVEIKERNNLRWENHNGKYPDKIYKIVTNSYRKY